MPITVKNKTFFLLIDIIVTSVKKIKAMQLCFSKKEINKANLWDLIAATSLVVLLKLDSNSRLFSPCDLEIWWITLINNWHLFYATLSFLHHFVAISEFKLELQYGNA